jgi:methyl-accepting chemotaxis protein
MFRRTYIIKPALQIKFLLYGLTGVVLAMRCAYAVLHISVVRSEDLSQLSQGELHSIQSAMRTALLWLFVLLALSLSVVGVVLFHRVIGPLYAVEKVLRMIADGDLTVYMPLRRGDELREVADAVEQMVGGIRRRVLRDKEHVLAAQTALRRVAEANPAAKAELDAASAKLDKVGQEFRLG